MMKALLMVTIVWLLWVGVAYLVADRAARHPLFVQAAAPVDPPCLARPPLLRTPRDGFDYRQGRPSNDRGIA